MAFLFREDDLSTTAQTLSVNGSPTFGSVDNPGGKPSMFTDAITEYLYTSWVSAFAQGTVSTWYKGTDVGEGDGYSNGGKMLIGAATSSSNKAWGIILDTEGKPRFYAGSTSQYVNHDTAINDDEWHMVTMVLRGGGSNFTAYVDGVNIGTSGTYDAETGGPPLRVGGPSRGQTDGPLGNYADCLFDTTTYDDDAVAALFIDGQSNSGNSFASLGQMLVTG